MKRKPYSDALPRLFQIVTLMHSQTRLTQRDLAAACECSERQVRRYLKALEAAGVSYEHDQKRGYFLPQDKSPLSLPLSLQETLALLLARQWIVGRADLPFAHSAQTVFDKIANLLPTRLRQQLESDTVDFHSGGKRNYADAPWGQLLDAVKGCKRLTMDYHTLSTNTRSIRRVDPYHIVWLHGYCHLIAYCHNRQQVLNFALDSILDVQPTGETFVVPKTFSLADHLRGASGPMLGDPVQVTIHFDAETARYARRRSWEFPHTFDEQADGSIILRGTVRGLSDIRKEVLSWGRHACVLEPETLRRELHEHACMLVAFYAPSRN